MSYYSYTIFTLYCDPWLGFELMDFLLFDANIVLKV